MGTDPAASNGLTPKCVPGSTPPLTIDVDERPRAVGLGWGVLGRRRVDVGLQPGLMLLPPCAAGQSGQQAAGLIEGEIAGEEPLPLAREPRCRWRLAAAPPPTPSLHACLPACLPSATMHRCCVRGTHPGGDGRLPAHLGTRGCPPPCKRSPGRTSRGRSCTSPYRRCRGRCTGSRKTAPSLSCSHGRRSRPAKKQKWEEANS